MFKSLKITALALAILFPAKAFADVNIVLIAPFDGENAQYGHELLFGVETAIRNINESGGLLGKRINLTLAEDMCDGQLAVTTAQMLSLRKGDEKVSMVIGPYCSQGFTEASDIYAAHNIIQILPTSVIAKPNQKNHPGLIKMLGFKNQSIRDIFNYCKKDSLNKKLALVYDGANEENISIVKSIQNGFRKQECAEDIAAYNLNDYENMRSLSKDIIDKGFEMAFVMGKSDDISRLAKILRIENKFFVVIVDRYQVDREFFRSMGKYANGTRFIGLVDMKEDPDFAETLVKLRLLGIEPEGLAAYGYSAVDLWENIVKEADSFSYDKITKVIKENKVTTTWGEITFNNGKPLPTLNYVIYDYQDGEYAQVR